MRTLAVAGVGLYTRSSLTSKASWRADSSASSSNNTHPRFRDFFLYFPSRAQVSPALKAFVEVASQLMKAPKSRRSSN
jgi:hypothetical protein